MPDEPIAELNSPDLHRLLDRETFRAPDTDQRPRHRVAPAPGAKRDVEELEDQESSREAARAQEEEDERRSERSPEPAQALDREPTPAELRREAQDHEADSNRLNDLAATGRSIARTDRAELDELCDEAPRLEDPAAREADLKRAGWLAADARDRDRLARNDEKDARTADLEAQHAAAEAEAEPEPTQDDEGEERATRYDDGLEPASRAAIRPARSPRARTSRGRGASRALRRSR